MIKYGLACCVLLGMVSGCANGESTQTSGPVPSFGAAKSPASLIPPEFRPAGPMLFHGIPAPRNQKTRGIYVSAFYLYTIMGYPPKNRNNGTPTCYVPGEEYVQGIAADDVGDLVVPEGGSRRIDFFSKNMCGFKIGSVFDAFGQPSDVAIDRGSALTQYVVIGHIIDNSVPGGSISKCSLAKNSCKLDLFNDQLGDLAGVATRNGDCWGSGRKPGGTKTPAVLIYFAHCRGHGRLAQGFKNAYLGGLAFDGDGNLLSISAFDAKLYVYKGCDPKCSLVGGPFALNGNTVFGRLNAKSTEFVAADFQYGQIDVYKYSPTKLSYEYSFDNGLSPSNDVEGTAVNPE